MTDIINDRWCFSAGSIIAFCLVTILVHFVIAGYSLQLHKQYRRERLSNTGLLASVLVGEAVGSAIANSEKSSSTDSTGSTDSSTSDPSSTTTTTTSSSSSMPGWEIALIVLGSAVGGTALIAGAMYLFD